jgi:hypothetical protein
VAAARCHYSRKELLVRLRETGTNRYGTSPELLCHGHSPFPFI